MNPCASIRSMRCWFAKLSGAPSGHAGGKPPGRHTGLISTASGVGIADTGRPRLADLLDTWYTTSPILSYVLGKGWRPAIAAFYTLLKELLRDPSIRCAISGTNCPG